MWPQRSPHPQILLHRVCPFTTGTARDSDTSLYSPTLLQTFISPIGFETWCFSPLLHYFHDQLSRPYRGFIPWLLTGGTGRSWNALWLLSDGQSLRLLLRVDKSWRRKGRCLSPTWACSFQTLNLVQEENYSFPVSNLFPIASEKRLRATWQ